MKAAIYARVSTKDQDCGLQLAELRAYCARNGWETEEYVDTGWSGAKTSRPAFDRLMEDARQRRIDIVTVWKLDRWGRSVLHLAESLQELRRFNVRWIAVTQNIDTDKNNPTSRLLLNILGSVAEFEREMIRERVAAGMQQHKINVSLGRLGKDLHTRSGKDLPAGRPKAVFDRLKARELRAGGASLRDISREFKVGLGTVQRLLNGNVSGN